MTEATSGPLRDAYEAIQANNLPLARTILGGYLKTEPNNADGWWLMNYAANDGHEAREALQNVLRIDPTYPGARELLDEVNQKIQALPAQPSTPVFSAAPAASPAAKPTPVPPVAAKPAADEDDDDDFDDDEDDDEPSSRRRWLIAALGFVAVLALIWVVFGWLPSRTPAVIPATSVATVPTQDSVAATVAPLTPDAQAALPTDMPVENTPSGEATVAVEVTDAPITTVDATVAPDTGQFATLYEALSGFSVVDGSITTEQTNLGTGLVSSVCTSGSAAELRTLIPSVLVAMAQNAGANTESVQVIGTKLTDCASGRVVRYVGVPSTQAQAFVNGDIDETAFRAAIQVITP
jgi:hypothetical protein